MRLRTIILSVLLLMLAVFPLRAQWSGRVGLSTGFGGMNGDKETGIGFLGHVLAEGDATLNYKTEKFTWTTAVGGKWEPRSSDNTRLNLDLKQPQQVGMDLVYKTVKTQPLQLDIRSDFGWKPSKDRRYAAWISYRYKNDRARNVSNTLSGTLNLEGIDEEELNHYYRSPRYILDLFARGSIDSPEAGCYFETPKMNEDSLGTGALGEWQLSDKNLLHASFSISTTMSRRNTLWSVFKTSEAVSDDVDVNAAFIDGNASMYRITPSTIDMDFAADIHLRRTVRENDIRFRWTPGVRFFGNHSLDHNSGATLSDIKPDGSYVWQDSLRLRENFNFLSLNAAPFVAFEYRTKKVELLTDYSLQFYFRQLNDDSHRQPLMMLPPKPVGKASFTWKISDVHKLGVTHEVGVDYPDFLEICWYDRTGGYIDQLFRGNTDLVSTMHSRYGLAYELKYKIFTYRTNNFITRRIDEIDQTWSNEEIEGRMYKVFSWVNSSDSWSFGTTHNFAWKWKWLDAGLGVEYNQSRRKAKDDGAVKDASDWRLTGNTGFNLGKDWLFSAKAMYQSKVSTFFTSFNEYWELDARLQKKFRKITVFLDGRDLLDNARRTTFESVDGDVFWVDVARLNRRLFLLGVQWNF